VGDLVSLVFAFAIAVVLTPVGRWIGVRVGMVDQAGDDPLKVHPEPVSVLGGGAVIAAALGAAALDAWPSGWVVGAIILAFATGLVDDLRRLPPPIRVVLQTATGAMLVAGGLGLEVFGPLAAAGTVLLVLACVNAVNLLDGQDGLAGGLAAIGSLGLAAVAAWEGQDAASALALALGGGLLGFLVWNRPPAQIFLGNGGAYAVGTFLAVLAAAVASRGWTELLAAGVCLGVLVFELAFTVVRRLGARASVSAGDRMHSYDLLAALSRSRTRSTVAFLCLGLGAAGLSLIVSRVALPVGALLAGLASVGAGLWGIRLWSRGTALGTRHAVTEVRHRGDGGSRFRL
jgi:UDP-GlcNAc:undecaprenyl-phosphate/decaprenyl-phosphate GlcNAc-1-phosphate transferase